MPRERHLRLTHDFAGGALAANEEEAGGRLMVGCSGARERTRLFHTIASLASLISLLIFSRMQRLTPR